MNQLSSKPLFYLSWIAFVIIFVKRLWAFFLFIYIYFLKNLISIHFHLVIIDIFLLYDFKDQSKLKKMMHFEMQFSCFSAAHIPLNIRRLAIIIKSIQCNKE